MRDNETNLLRAISKIACRFSLVLLILLLGTSVSGQKQTAKIKNFSPTDEAHALYQEYRGLRLGMTVEEVRAKLGEPKFGDAEMDFYVISENETTQIAYDKAHRVKTISTDYVDGLGAPDYHTVVGASLSQKPDGSQYKMLTYDKEGFWVSYNKSSAGLVTVTIQAMIK